MSNPRRSNGHRRDQQRARWRALGRPCYICGRPIDYTLKAPAPWSFVIDETVPLKHGGSMTWDNQGPAHWWCNRIKSTHNITWARTKVAELITAGKVPHSTRDTETTHIISSDWFGPGE